MVEEARTFVRAFFVCAMSLPLFFLLAYVLGMSDEAATYKRREPENTILYQVLDKHIEGFYSLFASDPCREALPGFVWREFDKFLGCGLLSEGFVRVKCSDCSESMVVAFSCKCRGFCPSCAGRRMSERSIYLVENVIPFVPTRHWVLSVPFELRYWLASNDQLLKKVNQILCDEVRNYLRKKARNLGVRGGEFGVVSFLQRAGSALNLNPHFHLLVLDGIYIVGDDGFPIFHRIPGITNDEVSTVVRKLSRRVIRYLRKTGKLSAEGEEVYIGDELQDQSLILSHLKRSSISSRIALGPRAGLKVRRIGSSFGFEEEIPKNRGYGCASMNGFSIHAATSIKAHERHRLEQLLRYLGRGPVSHEKISRSEDGHILYELKKSFDGATHVLFSPLEFIEKLASIIPPPYKHQVNYYGCLSSHSKLRPLIMPGAVLDEITKTSSGQPSAATETVKESDQSMASETKQVSNYIPWSELLKRTFGIDLTVCVCCGGKLRVIAAIFQRDSVQKILGYLGLATGPPNRTSVCQTEYVYEDFP